MYCSNSCRATAANMKKSADQRALAESMALESIREKIEPVTRELLTDTVLKELNSLVNLLPAAIEELKYELSRDADGRPVVEDSDLRHKAAVQLLKFTISNSSIAPASADREPAPLQVFIGGGMESNVGVRVNTVEVDGELVETRECAECHISKKTGEFVGESPRCLACNQKLIDEATEKFGADLVRSVQDE